MGTRGYQEAILAAERLTFGAIGQDHRGPTSSTCYRCPFAANRKPRPAAPHQAALFEGFYEVGIGERERPQAAPMLLQGFICQALTAAG